MKKLHVFLAVMLALALAAGAWLGGCADTDTAKLKVVTSTSLIAQIVERVGGEAVADHDELATKLTGEVVGQAAAVNVLRVGELITVEVTVGERQMHRRGRRKRRPQKRGDRRHAQRGRSSRHHRRHHP